MTQAQELRIREILFLIQPFIADQRLKLELAHLIHVILARNSTKLIEKPS